MPDTKLDTIAITKYKRQGNQYKPIDFEWVNDFRAHYYTKSEFGYYLYWIWFCTSIA